MSRIAYVNGRYLPRRDAMVNIEDRGYQFADGVYELCEVKDGRVIDERRHIERLRRSLAELQIAFPLTPAALGVVMRETIRRNRVRNPKRADIREIKMLGMGGSLRVRP